MAQTRINFLTATIKDLQELLCKGEITSVQLIKSYMVRICHLAGFLITLTLLAQHTTGSHQGE
jgi:hypothetical protein